MKGVLLNTEFDIQVNAKRDSRDLITGGLVVGNNTDQCAAITLGMQQGELKEDPLLGAGLTHAFRGKFNKSQIDQRIRQHLTRAGINYQEHKQRIQTTINTEE